MYLGPTAANLSLVIHLDEGEEWEALGLQVPLHATAFNEVDLAPGDDTRPEDVWYPTWDRGMYYLASGATRFRVASINDFTGGLGVVTINAGGVCCLYLPQAHTYENKVQTGRPLVSGVPDTTQPLRLVGWCGTSDTGIDTPC